MKYVDIKRQGMKLLETFEISINEIRWNIDIYWSSNIMKHVDIIFEMVEKTTRFFKPALDTLTKFGAQITWNV